MSAPRLLVIGWDAVDWDLLHPLIDAGQLPNLARLLEAGCMASLRVPIPDNPASAWMTLACGRRAHEHGVFETTAADADLPGYRVPAGRAARRTPTFWEAAADGGHHSIAVGWPSSHPAAGRANLEEISDWFPLPTAPPGDEWPPAPGTVSPADALERLSALRVRPDEIDVATLLAFVPEAASIDQDRDASLALIATLVAGAASLHAAATDLLPGDWRVAAVRYPTLLGFQEWFPSSAEGSIFRHVLPAALKFHDAMLGTLAAMLFPEDTLVLLSNRCRLRPADGTQPRGIFVAAGPRIATDQIAFGAHTLDVAPTLAAIAGFPADAAWSGRVMAEIFRPGTIFRVAERSPAAPAEPEPLVEDDEHLWLKAQSHWDARDYLATRKILEALLVRAPEFVPGWLLLGRVDFRLHDLDAAEREFERVIALAPEAPAASLVRGMIACERGAHALALEHLDRAKAGGLSAIPLWLYLGDTYGKLRRWTAAFESYARAADMDSSAAAPLLGLAVASYRQRDFCAAVDFALEAVRRDFSLAAAHLLLGRAHARCGRWKEARLAIETALRLDPRNRAGRKWQRFLNRRLISSPA